MLPLPYLGLLYYVSCVIDNYLRVKQNLGHAWLLGPHTSEKLISFNYISSVKQNLNYAWFLGPSALGKLTHYDNYLRIKQNLGHAWLLEPYTLGKLIRSEERRVGKEC